MSIRLMHLADLHLGASLSYLGEQSGERARDIESALTRALALAPEKNVDAVLIAGDLFDSFDPPSDLVARVRAAFEETVAKGMPVILIPGTHDSHHYARCVYTREEFPGVDVLLENGAPIRRDLRGHATYFYGFSGDRVRRRDTRLFRRGAGEGFHVALAHGTVNGGEHWSASSRDFSLNPDELEASGFDYVALGHHHEFREVRRGRPSVVYPGTLEGLKFGENGDRHLIIVNVSRDGTTLEKMKHNRKTLSEIRIDLTTSGIGCSDDLVRAIEKHCDPTGIVRVTLSGTADFLPVRGEIEGRVEGRFFYFELADNTIFCDGRIVRSIGSENTVRGIFVRKMIQKIERASEEGRAAAELALRFGIEEFTRITNDT